MNKQQVITFLQPSNDNKPKETIRKATCTDGILSGSLLMDFVEGYIFGDYKNFTLTIKESGQNSYGTLITKGDVFKFTEEGNCIYIQNQWENTFSIDDNGLSIPKVSEPELIKHPIFTIYN